MAKIFQGKEDLQQCLNDGVIGIVRGPASNYLQWESRSCGCD